MPSPTGRRATHIQTTPDYFRQQSGDAAFAHKITIPVGSANVFTSCTSIQSQYFIHTAVEVGSVGNLVGSAISNLVFQVWPGSGFNCAFANGIVAMVPVVCHVKFNYQV